MGNCSSGCGATHPGRSPGSRGKFALVLLQFGVRRATPVRARRCRPARRRAASPAITSRVAAEESMISSAARSAASLTVRCATVMPARCAIFSTAPRVRLGQHLRRECRGDQFASQHHVHGRGGAFREMAVAQQDGFRGARLPSACSRSRMLASSAVDLMSQRAPAIIRRRHAGRRRAPAQAASGRVSGELNANTVRSSFGSGA